MFSLIVTIVSIALVAALAVATVYYGGNALNDGKARAELAGLLNVSAQIGAAYVLLKATEPERALTAAGLPPPPYLAAQPEGWSGGCVEHACSAQKRLGSQGHALCLEANALAGLGHTLDLTVYTMATSRFYCVSQENESGESVDYLFTFNSGQ